MRRALAIAAFGLCGMLLSQCATEGAVGGSVELYGGAYYDDWWYGGGCCVDYPGDIGPPPPRPEHPIAKPPPATPSHPIASPAPRPMPSPRPMAAPRMGGRR